MPYALAENYHQRQHEYPLSPFGGTHELLHIHEQLSSKVTRQIRLLRDHGLIKKMPSHNRYYLTEKGRELTAVLNTVLDASIQQLMKMVA